MKTPMYWFGLLLATPAGASEYAVTLLELPNNANVASVNSISVTGQLSGMVLDTEVNNSGKAAWWSPSGIVTRFASSARSTAIGGPNNDIAILQSVGFNLVSITMMKPNGDLFNVDRASGSRWGAVRFGGNGSFYYGTNEKRLYQWDATNGSTFVASFPEATGDPGYFISGNGLIAATYQNSDRYDSVALVNGSREYISDFYIQAQGPAGEFLGYGQNRRAGIWRPGVGFTPLPAPSLLTYFPWGLNRSGTMIGHQKPFGSDALTGWIKVGDGPVVDFGTLSNISSFGATSYTLNAINDAGVIAGNMRFGEINRAFIARPVPEPASLVAFAIGGFAMLRRRNSA